MICKPQTNINVRSKQYKASFEEEGGKTHTQKIKGSNSDKNIQFDSRRNLNTTATTTIITTPTATTTTVNQPDQVNHARQQDTGEKGEKNDTLYTYLDILLVAALFLNSLFQFFFLCFQHLHLFPISNIILFCFHYSLILVETNNMNIIQL